MPTRKLAKQPQDMSPTTTTSTNQHHHLRHTGPSISTRTRARTTTPSKPPPAQPEHTPESASTGDQTHEKKHLEEISPPVAPRTSLTQFMYLFLLCVLLLLGWYIYGMVTLLDRLKDDVGWWGIIVGDSGGETWRGRGVASDRFGRGPGAAGTNTALEGSLDVLADALGISPVQVASAVKPLVPQASLASVALKAGTTGASSEAIRVLIGDTMRQDGEWGTGRSGDKDDTAEDGSTI